MSNKSTEQFTITGRVQGVGFRWFTMEVAKKLGVLGYVRNLPDGSVEAVAHGTNKQIIAFFEAISAGPPFAAVNHVSRSELIDNEPFTKFEITT